MAQNKIDADGKKVRKGKDTMNSERWLYLKENLVKSKGTNRVISGQKTRKKAAHVMRNAVRPASFGGMKRI